ncbi:MAG: 3-dehydroquinate dehydratase [Treponemataceae bacterium]|nr:3-dehydroquinate dehydratase [Treponemataceae bacterium]
MFNFLVLNGPNLNMLGIREPSIYGSKTYKDLIDMIKKHCDELSINVECLQSNSEGGLIDIIQKAYFDKIDGIIFNPGGYTHTSVAILDALKAVNIPTVEVHISEVSEREPFRKLSYVSYFACKTITGHGLKGYIEAIDFLYLLLKNKKNPHHDL